jgi:hypothetical protein
MNHALTVLCSNPAPHAGLLLLSEDNQPERCPVFHTTSTGMLLDHAHSGCAKAPGNLRSGINVTSSVNGGRSGGQRVTGAYAAAGNRQDAITANAATGYLAHG